MPLLADPIVKAMIKEFRAAVKDLKTASQQPSTTDSDRIAVVRQLCELSRDTRFHLGPPEFADEEQAEEVARCFEDGTREIRQLWAKGAIPKDVEKYCNNIAERADRCRGGR